MVSKAGWVYGKMRTYLMHQNCVLLFDKPQFISALLQIVKHVWWLKTRCKSYSQAACYHTSTARWRMVPASEHSLRNRLLRVRPMPSSFSSPWRKKRIVELVIVNQHYTTMSSPHQHWLIVSNASPSGADRLHKDEFSTPLSSADTPQIAVWDEN